MQGVGAPVGFFLGGSNPLLRVPGIEKLNHSDRFINRVFKSFIPRSDVGKISSFRWERYSLMKLAKIVHRVKSWSP